MHVSDWLPTILSFAGVDYTPASGHELDGVDHMLAITGKSSSSSPPRDKMLYNLVVHVEFHDYNLSTNGPLAVRNDRYKLIHEYTGSSLAGWYDAADWECEYRASETCRPDWSKGTYEMMLFDLAVDPNEVNNLYDDPGYAEVLVRLHTAVVTCFAGRCSR